jgi:uncharacterized protein (UPF0262 family)
MSDNAFNDATDKIVDIKLDEKSVIRRAVEVEHERKVAMYDLLDMNRFRPVGDYTGPFKVRVGIDDGKRLLFKIADESDTALTEVSLPLSPFRRIVRDYFQICESYYDAIKKLSPSQIETIDMARRGLHNDGAEVLVDALKDKIAMDKATSRRLFTLVCVLHIRG